MTQITPEMLMLNKHKLPLSAIDMMECLGIKEAALVINAIGGTEQTLPKTLRESNKVTELMELFGEELTDKIIFYYGGLTLSIPTCKTVFIEQRNKEIIKEYDNLMTLGLSGRLILHQLSGRFNMTSNQIWRVVNHYTKKSPKKRLVSPTAVTCANGMLVVELEDRRIISTPLTCVPRLAIASDEDRQGFTIKGRRIIWAKVGQSIHINDLLCERALGRFSADLPAGMVSRVCGRLRRC